MPASKKVPEPRNKENEIIMKLYRNVPYFIYLVILINVAINARMHTSRKKRMVDGRFYHCYYFAVVGEIRTTLY